jgi:hypothetical protein
VDPVEPYDWQIFGPEFSFWNLAFNTVHSDGFVVQRQQNVFQKFGFLENVGRGIGILAGGQIYQQYQSDVA